MVGERLNGGDLVLRPTDDVVVTSLAAWAEQAKSNEDWKLSGRWERLAGATLPSVDDAPDLYVVAERWLTLIAPKLEEHRRRQHRRAHFTLLRDVTPNLRLSPLLIEDVERQFSGIATAAPFADRVSACILGIPSPGGG